MNCPKHGIGWLGNRTSTIAFGMCPERKRLLLQYIDAIKAYYEAVRILAEIGGAALGADVQVIRINCRKALLLAEEARLALMRHEADHFCDSCLPPARS